MELLFDESALVFYKCGTKYGDIPKYAIKKIIWKLISVPYQISIVGNELIMLTLIFVTREYAKKPQTHNYQILIFFFFSCFYTLSEFLKLLRKWDFVNNFSFCFNSTFAKFTDLETLLYISP